MIALAGSRVGKVAVTIEVSPVDSKITLDGKPIAAGTIYVSKGKHTLKATRQHFSDDTQQFDTNDLERNTTIYLTPDPNTDEAKDYLKTHAEDARIRAIAGGQSYSETVEKTTRAYPVVSKLPHNAIDYRIDYSVDEQKNVSFQITLVPVATKPGTAPYIAQLKQFKAAALNWLRDEGVDITKAPITVTPDPDNQTAP